MEQNKYNDILPTRIRELIDEKGITQNAIATEVGITRQTISQYSDGSTIPNADKLAKLAQFFGVSADYLLGLTDAKTNDKDAQAVCDYTGLSSKSVEILHHEKNAGMRRMQSRATDSLNILIENRSLMANSDFLSLFLNYMDTSSLCVAREEDEDKFFYMYAEEGLSRTELEAISNEIFDNARERFLILKNKKNEKSVAYQELDEKFWESYYMTAMQNALFKLKRDIQGTNEETDSL